MVKSFVVEISLKINFDFFQIRVNLFLLGSGTRFLPVLQLDEGSFLLHESLGVVWTKL